jgi:hypothetical protein
MPVLHWRFYKFRSGKRLEYGPDENAFEKQKLPWDLPKAGRPTESNRD